MSMFRRKKPDPVVVEPDEAEVAAAAALAAEDEAEQQARAQADKAERRRRQHGPRDISEVDEGDETTWIDLGSLRIAPQPGLELRMEVVDEDQSVRSVTAVLGESQVQVQVFSGPRSTGVWDEVREGLVEEISRQGGTAEIQQGTFGAEILARLPARTPDGRTGHQATRFVGIDGPRWFLRGVIAGAAASSADPADDVEAVLSRCVVVRGPQALPPLDLLPLTLPSGAARRADEPGAEDDAPTLRAPERGPEIAEIR